MDEHPAVDVATAQLALLDAAGDVSLLGLSGVELDTAIELELVLASRHRARLAGLIEQAALVDRPAELDAPGMVPWLRGRFGLSPATAARYVRDAQALRGAPAAAEAARYGAVQTEAAVEIGRALAVLPAAVGPELVRHGEQVLVDLAVGTDGPALNPLQLRYAGRHLHEILDPDAADRLLAARLDREEADTCRRRYLSITDDGHGGTRVHGLLTAEAGARLRTVLSTLAAPRPAAPGDPAEDRPVGDVSAGGGAGPGNAEATNRAGTRALGVDGPRSAVPGASGVAGCGSTRESGPTAAPLPDDRSYAQRLADALDESMDRLLALGELPAAGGDRPQLLITVDHDRLAGEVGAGTLADGTELSPATIRRIACDAGIIPAVLGTGSQVLDLGRTARTATPAQRRALALRAGGCEFPWCDKPPGWTQAHHVREWGNLGPTDLANLVLLCGHDHRLIHHGGWEIEPDPDGGRPFFIPPAWIDPERQPRRNHLHHTRDLLVSARGQLRAAQPSQSDDARDLSAVGQQHAPDREPDQLREAEPSESDGARDLVPVEEPPDPDDALDRSGVGQPPEPGTGGS